MPPVCNKCRQGLAQEADSWCLGCSSLELAQGLLKQPWRLPGLRATAEEAILSSARLVRAFANLDQSLPQGGAGSSVPAPAVASKSRASRPARSRTPRRDPRPPLARPSPRRSTKVEPRSEESYDTDFEEEEEEEDSRPDKEVHRERRGSDRPPEPERAPPGYKEQSPPPAESGHVRASGGDRKHPKKRRSDNHGRRRRGGARHQKRYKDIQDPFRRSHRKLRGDILELAQSFEDGITRRY